MNIISPYISALQNRAMKLLNLRRGWRTSKHIIVFESDDWGSIRVPSKDAYNALIKQGYCMDKRPYERYDTLESNADVEALFDVLSKYKGADGKPPIITTNVLSANPDFKKIQEHNFEKYFYKSIEKTYEETPRSEKVIELFRQGVEQGIVRPQSHGREHFNVNKWMKALASKDKDAMVAFEYGMCGIFPKDNPKVGNQYMVAYNKDEYYSKEDLQMSIDDALNIFKDIWGYRSRSFIAPCYIWNEDVEQCLFHHGIELIQSAIFHQKYRDGKRYYHFIGQKNDFGQMYSVRNCLFEPSTTYNEDVVDRALKDISNAFAEGRPAIVSTHRINYVSGIDTSNRDKTLFLLDSLLSQIINRYNDVVFMSSDALLEYVINSKNSCYDSVY